MAEPIRATRIENDTYGFRNTQRHQQYDSYLGFQLPERTVLVSDRRRDEELNQLKDLVLTHVQYWVRQLDEKLIRLEQKIKALEERDEMF